MRYFKLIICFGIMLLLSGAATAQEGFINIFAGGGPNGVKATTAPVYTPTNVALDSGGNIYFSSQGGTTQHRVWKIAKSTGTLTIVAGSYSDGYSGDGGLATNAQLHNPQGIAIDEAGNVFIADDSNCIVREVKASGGVITTIAGTPQSCSYSGDGSAATSARLNAPTGVAFDKNGNLFIADYNNQRVRMVACATVTSTGGSCTPNSGQKTGDIYTVAGTGTPVYNGDGIQATTANLYSPYGVTTDTAGNLYIADQYDQLVRRVACGTGISGCTAPTGETKGYIYTLAGTGESSGHAGTAGYNGDGMAATGAELYYPATVSVDNEGNLFIGDQYNQRIREVSCATKTSSGGACTASKNETAGEIFTVAGTGSAGYSGDGGDATGADLYYPVGVAVDGAGDLFIGDFDNNRIREVPCDVSTLTCTPPAGDTAQDIYTFAGSGITTFYGNDVPAIGAELDYPSGAASDSAGNIYITDHNNCVIREVSATTGDISTFAGTPPSAAGNPSCGYSGDGGAATSALLYYPWHVTVDSADNVYIADVDDCRIRKVSGGTISTVAGNGTCGYSGDGGAATAAELYEPSGVALDHSGNLYIADQYNHVVRKVSGGTISTFAGDHTLGAGYSGDGGPAAKAQLYYPIDVAVDSAGNVYIADQYNHRIRKVNTSGIIDSYAGNGYYIYQGDNGPANETSLYYPTGVAVDRAGDVIIADQDNQRVRLVDGEGIIHTIAGNGTNGFYGNDVLATTAELYQPDGVTVDPSGNIYEADYQNWLVRKITAPITLNSSLPSITFDTQTINTTSDAVALTLSANGTADIASITPTAGFLEVDDCPTALTSGSTCLVNLRFSPTTDGVINGTLTVKYNGFLTSSLVVPLQGEGSGLSISPVSLGFGTQLVTATPVTKTVTVTGKTTYSSPSATLDGSAAFTIASNTCTGAITTSCAIGIKFAPTSATLGAVKNTLIIHDNDPTNPQLLALTGTGTEVTLTPTTLAFGTVASGSAVMSVKVTNVGTTILSFSKAPTITGTGSTNFVVLPYSATGPQSTCLNGTVTLAQNASCTYTVQFTFAGGTTSFTTDLNIFDNGGASPQVVVMTATD